MQEPENFVFLNPDLPDFLGTSFSHTLMMDLVVKHEVD